MAPELVPAALKPATFGAKNQASIPRRAYVTFLAGNGDYVKGVVGLAKGLRKVKTAHPLVVAVLPDVPEEHRRILESQGCIVREIEPVYPPENQTQFAMAYYVINYSKLRIWEVPIYLPTCVYIYFDLISFAYVAFLLALHVRILHSYAPLITRGICGDTLGNFCPIVHFFFF